MAINGTSIQDAGRDRGTQTDCPIGSGQGWATPTSGNIIIVSAGGVGDGGNQSISLTNFNKVHLYEPNSNFGIFGAFFWKESDGSETTITPTLSSAVTWWSALAVEFDGTDLDTSALDASNEDESEVSSGSTTAPTGSATNTVADALVIGMINTTQSNQWSNGTRSWSNSFGEEGAVTFDSARNGHWVATKVVSSAASQSSILTTTDTGGENYGGIFIFAGTEVSYPHHSTTLKRRRAMNPLLTM